MQELRLAVRRLTRRPGAALASVATLACSIGAAAATWSLLSAVLLRPLPVGDPDRLMVVGTRETVGRSAGMLRSGFDYPFLALIREAGVFDHVAAVWGPPSLLPVATGGTPARIGVGFATYDYFSVLQVAIPLGRGFTSDDDRRGAPPVAILLDRYWRTAFEASPSAIGQSITVSGKAVTIVGVAARGFRGLDLAAAPEFYLPLHTIADIDSPLTNYFAETSHPNSPTLGLSIIGRLHAGDTPTQATARLSSVNLAYGGRNAPTLGLTPVNVSAVPARARAGMVQFTRLLTITVGLLLLIGCGTVGLLLLIRTEARREEFATCVALGASGAQLARGVVLEGAVLSMAGAVLAVPVTWWLFAGLRAFQLPGNVAIERLELGLDARALFAAIGGAVISTIVITLIAGVFGVAAGSSDALRWRAGATARVTRRRTRSALVTAQVAVTLVLLAGAGLFTRSLQAALGLNASVGMDRIVTGDVSLAAQNYGAGKTADFFDDLYHKLRANPALRSVTYGVEEGGMSPMGRLLIDGAPRQFPSMVWFKAVDSRYFRTMGLALLSGRDFADSDGVNAPPVAIVSESFARMLANGGDAIGHRITSLTSRPGQPRAVMEIIGVVQDVVTNVSVLEPLATYFPLAPREPHFRRTITMRASTDANAVRRELMSAIKQLDPAVMPAQMLTLKELIDVQMSAQRFGALVLGALGAIAMLLTVLGTYVLAESMAVLRLREMGIRAALGATGRQLGGIVLAEITRLVGAGLVVGLALAWIGAGTIRAFLFHVQPLDPATLIAVAVAILTMAFLVSLRPALHAARVDLGRVLKEE